jgi:hypothetical protein
MMFKLAHSFFDLFNDSSFLVTQIMNLFLLAPDIQESILFLPPVEKGKDTLLLKHLQPIALEVDRGRQRELWRLPIVLA